MTTVLGGGLSGLAAGYYLLKRYAQPFTLYESSIRLGGWIRTEQHKEKGFTFEAGPRTIRPKGLPGANTLELIEDLQLDLDDIRSEHAAAKNRLIYSKGKLCLLPNSLGSIFKTLDPFSKPLVSALCKDLVTGGKRQKHGDESIYDFVARRFGREIADLAISPMICGICAGDAKEISVRFLMNDIFEREQRWGGVLRGYLFSIFSSKKNKSMVEGLFAEQYPNLFNKATKEKWSMYRVRNGLETLPKTLGQYLRNHDVNLQMSSECKKLVFTKEGVRMTVKDNEVLTRHVISSIPSYKLAPCVQDQHPSLAAQLLTIPYVDVAVVNLQYTSKDLLNIDAFGFLVPPIEKLPILGVIFDSCCFDMKGNTVLTVMMGGKWFTEYFGKSPSQKELLDTALQYIDKILHITHEPKQTRVHILHKCIPQYVVGHKERVSNIRNYIKKYNLPLSLCGAAYDGVGINDVILSARNQVYQLKELTCAP